MGQVLCCPGRLGSLAGLGHHRGSCLCRSLMHQSPGDERHSNAVTAAPPLRSFRLQVRTHSLVVLGQCRASGLHNSLVRVTPSPSPFNMAGMWAALQWPWREGAAATPAPKVWAEHSIPPWSSGLNKGACWGHLAVPPQNCVPRATVLLPLRDYHIGYPWEIYKGMTNNLPRKRSVLIFFHFLSYFPLTPFYHLIS